VQKIIFFINVFTQNIHFGSQFSAPWTLLPVAAAPLALRPSYCQDVVRI